MHMKCNKTKYSRKYLIRKNIILLYIENLRDLHIPPGTVSGVISKT
jgi:hypothetical protein